MITELAKQIFESVLVDGGLKYTDENGLSGNLKIAQICIDDVDNKNISENKGEYRFPIVVFEEGTSNAKSPLYSSNPNTSQLYDTDLRIIVYSKDADESASVCYAAQVAVLRGFYEKTLNSSETHIDAASWGTKQPSSSGSLMGVKNLWSPLIRLKLRHRLRRLMRLSIPMSLRFLRRLSKAYYLR